MSVDKHTQRKFEMRCQIGDFSGLRAPIFWAVVWTVVGSAGLLAAAEVTSLWEIPIGLSQ